MRLRTLAASIPALLFTVIAACTGDDPASSSGAVNPDGGAEGGNPAAITCGAGNACSNNAPCVDGYCCQSACTGTCEACNVAGQEGRCTAVKGTPKHGKCDGDATGSCAGSCDGTKRDSCTYPEVACGTPASCAGGSATVAVKCKAGTCPAQSPQKCALGCLEDGCLGVTHVAAGYYHACAVLTDKRVRCWGKNDAGQTGQDTFMAQVKSPMSVPGIANALMVATTFSTTCALLSDKTVKCWGSNSGAGLGTGTADANPHPTPAVVPGVTDATFLSGSSGGHFCAIVTGGAIKCWGGNGYGQLGDGSMSTTKGVVTVCQPGADPCVASSGAMFVAGGDNHTCATFAGNKVACWGNNSLGELGQPTSVTLKSLVPLFVPANFTATHLTAGNQITCAASGGEAKCFGGSGGQGRLGNGQDSVDVSTPTSVCTKQDCSAKLTGVTQVTTFDESSCALASGAVQCWGSNTGGQLGDGNATSAQNYAATKSIAAGAVAVASGGGAHYAIVIDGPNRDIRCWGSEGEYQCGTGVDSKNRPSPVAPKW